MAVPAPRSNETTQFGRYSNSDNYGSGIPRMEFQPGERIGGPVASARRRAIIRASVVGAIVLGGGWVWLNHKATLSEWTQLVSASVSSMLERKAPDPVATEQPLAPLQRVEVSPPTATAGLTEAPPATAPAEPSETAALDENSAAQPIERLPPPVVDPADPYQARALAVGLHPGLSRVLLEKLSPTDYRNAGIAIKTALAQPPDAEAVIWPRQRTPELAVFKVKFVPGAAVDCRRYVVMVSMEGWLTTALPMEKCDIPKVEQPAAVGTRKKL